MIHDIEHLHDCVTLCHLFFILTNLASVNGTRQDKDLPADEVTGWNADAGLAVAKFAQLHRVQDRYTEHLGYRSTEWLVRPATDPDALHANQSGIPLDSIRQSCMGVTS